MRTEKEIECCISVCEAVLEGLQPCTKKSRLTIVIECFQWILAGEALDDEGRERD